MRKLRIALGILLLVLSCAVLVWGVWPAARVRHVLPISPTEMQLPTPSSFTIGAELVS
jgi:hypothetical protein